MHRHGLIELSVWLIRLGICVNHSAPYHPQTNGKSERFHRALKAEVLAGRSVTNLQQTQAAFERWRGVYNHDRPHDAPELETPAKRYQPSLISYAKTLPPIEYADGDTVALVKWNGEVHFKGNKLRVSSALLNLPIAFRPDTKADGCYDVFFCHHWFMRLDLNTLAQAC